MFVGFKNRWTSLTFIGLTHHWRMYNRPIPNMALPAYVHQWCVQRANINRPGTHGAGRLCSSMMWQSMNIRGFRNLAFPFYSSLPDFILLAFPFSSVHATCCHLLHYTRHMPPSSPLRKPAHTLVSMRSTLHKGPTPPLDAGPQLPHPDTATRCRQPQLIALLRSGARWHPSRHLSSHY
jgi:hypothetical protein